MSCWSPRPMPQETEQQERRNRIQFARMVCIAAGAAVMFAAGCTVGPSITRLPRQRPPRTEN